MSGPAWIKLDEGFFDHPKVIQAGPLGALLAITAIAWSKRNKTDGYVPAGQVARLVNFLDISLEEHPVNALRIAEDLEEVGLWNQVPGGWRIHDYLDWQTPASAVVERALRKRDQGRERAARHRAKSRATTENTPGNAAVTPGVTQSSRTSNAGVKSLENREQQNSTVEFRVFKHWQQRCKHPQAKFSPDRKAKVRARLKDGYTEEQLRQAIDGAAKAAFVNDAGHRFDDLELICRNGSKLEGFMERANGRRHASDAETAKFFLGDNA